MAIVIIADDLSGAAELAGIAFARGYTAEVQRQFEPASAAEVIAVDTDTRGLPEKDAAAKVGAIAAAVAASRPAWIYKKTDSVLRGHPAAEIAAVLAASGQARSLLVPANPSRGRTIAGGVYRIGGAPLDQTPFAGDPEFPRRSAIVADLLGKAPAIGVPDAAGLEDVYQLAVALDEKTLPAGAADFFTAMLAKRGDQRPSRASEGLAPLLLPPRLLVCGSPASWPRRRLALAAAQIPTRELDGLAAADAIGGSSSQAIGIGDLVPPVSSPAALLARITQLAEDVLQRVHMNVILVEGGATAAALAERMGWTRFRVIAQAPAGVGVLASVAANAPTLLIKPGSYDWPEEIWRQFFV